MRRIRSQGSTAEVHDFDTDERNSLVVEFERMTIQKDDRACFKIVIPGLIKHLLSEDVASPVECFGVRSEFVVGRMLEVEIDISISSFLTD